MSRRQQRARHARRKHANAKMRALGVAGGVAVASLGSVGAAQADQTYTVTTTADSGVGSLRDAITQANANPGNDTITFAPSVSLIQPSSDLPALTTDLTITGPGARSLTIDGEHTAAGAQPMFTAGDHNLTITGLTIENDNLGAVSESGSGKQLLLQNDEIVSNGGPAAVSGGISVTGGSLIVGDSTIDGNTGASAGGILATGAGSVSVQESTFSGDTSGGSGGAINLQNTQATVADSTFESNTAHTGQSGGGIEVGAMSGLTLENSILDADTASIHSDLDVAPGASANLKFSLVTNGGDVAQAGVVADGETTALAGQPAQISSVGRYGGQTDTALPATGSPVIDSGKEFVGQTTDQRGAPRTVGTATGSGDGTDIGAVEWQPVPTVTGISPSSGSAGDTVTITGTNSGAVEGVKFGTVDAQSYTVVNSTTITAVVPVLSTLPSTVDVTVVEGEGTSATSANDQFSGTAGTHSYAVTSLNDSGSGSLRDAIQQANVHAGDDTITFASGLSGTIALTSPLPQITTQLSLEGPGARALAVDASGITETYAPPILNGRASSGPLVVSGLTLEHGNGGAIASYRQLTVDGVTVTHNGLPQDVANPVRSSIDTLYSEYGGMTVENSTVTGNTSYLGQAIDAYQGIVNVRDSTISGNQQGSAGAIYGYATTQVNVDDSTITGNLGGDDSGGVFIKGGALAVRDSVVAGNTATGGATSTPDVDLASGATGTAAFSLIGQTTAEPGFTLNDDQSRALVGKNPLLGPLQNNGGPTDTQLPQAGSPLLDAGQANGQTTDQRGLPRPQRVVFAALPAGGDGSDIGAAEVQPPPVTTTTTTTTSTTTKTTPLPPARPILSRLSARSGSSGQSVKITGSHLTGASAVKFGSVKAKFRVTSDGSITATVPSSHGKVGVTVTGPGGTAGSADKFSYLSPSVGHHRASAKWKGSSVVVDTGLFAICPKGGDRCSVSAKATSVVPASLARVRKVKTRSLTLGSARFHVSAGKRGEVTFTLTRKGLKALEKLGELKITVAVTVVDGSVTTKQSRAITIHLPKKPKPKPKKR